MATRKLFPQSLSLPRVLSSAASSALLCGLTLLILWLLAPATARAQDAPDASNAPNIVGSISGRVVDEAGEPLAGILVSAQAQDPTKSMGQSYAETDANGRYRFDNLVTGLYRVEFRERNGRYAFQYFGNTQSYEEAELVPVTGSNVTGIDATLMRPGQIRGTVVLTGSLATLEPDALPNLTITYAFYAERGGELAQIYTGQQYADFNFIPNENRYDYRLDGLAPGIYRLCVTGDFYGVDFQTHRSYTECYDDALLFEEADSVDVTAGSAADGIDITLGDNDDYATLAGQVTGVGGAPLAGVLVALEKEVQFTPSFPYPIPSSYSTFVYTDAQGRYRFDSLLPDTYWLRFTDEREIAIDDSSTIRYLPESYDNRPPASAATPIEIAKAQSLEIDAQLAAGGAIIGRIELGNSLNGSAYLELIREDRSERLYVSTQVEPVANGSALLYRLDGIPSGRYYLQVVGYPFTKFYPNQPTLDDATLITVEAGQVTANIDFPDITQGPESGAVTGRATVSNGDPAANVPVALYSRTIISGYPELLFLATTDREGRYRLSTPEAGSYHVCFGELGYEQLPEYRYGCYNGNNVTSTGALSETKEITVDAGETATDINLRVQRHSQVRGRVQTEDGLPLEYGYLTLYRRAQGDDGDDSTAGGWVPVSSIYLNNYGEPVSTYGLNVEPGAYRLGLDAYSPYGNQIVFYPNAPTIEEATTITLVNGEQLRDIDFILPDPADASLSGTVTQDGEPLAGARVDVYLSYSYYGSYYGEPTPLIYTTTDANGQYEIRGLFANYYSVRFVDPAGELTTRWYGGSFSASSAQTIELADGEARSAVDVEMGQFVFDYLPLIGR